MDGLWRIWHRKEALRVVGDEKKGWQAGIQRFCLSPLMQSFCTPLATWLRCGAVGSSARVRRVANLFWLKEWAQRSLCAVEMCRETRETGLTLEQLLLAGLG